MRYQYWIVNVEPRRPWGYSFCVKVDSSLDQYEVERLARRTDFVEHKDDWIECESIFNEDERYYSDGPDEYARQWMKDAIELPPKTERVEMEESTDIPLW